jgi:hypothetical protein
MLVETAEGYIVKFQYSQHGPFTSLEEAERFQKIYEVIESICMTAESGYSYSVDKATEYIMSLYSA